MTGAFEQSSSKAKVISEALSITISCGECLLEDWVQSLTHRIVLLLEFTGSKRSIERLIRVSGL
jgi:hypothetical protein